MIRPEQSLVLHCDQRAIWPPIRTAIFTCKPSSGYDYLSRVFIPLAGVSSITEIAELIH